VTHFYRGVGLINQPDMPKMLNSKGFGCAPATLDHLVLHQVLELGMRKCRTPDAVRLFAFLCYLADATRLELADSPGSPVNTNPAQ
jgi:hypothetical protein